MRWQCQVDKKDSIPNGSKNPFYLQITYACINALFQSIYLSTLIYAFIDFNFIYRFLWIVFGVLFSIYFIWSLAWHRVNALCRCQWIYLNNWNKSLPLLLHFHSKPFFSVCFERCIYQSFAIVVCMCVILISGLSTRFSLSLSVQSTRIYSSLHWQLSTAFFSNLFCAKCIRAK